MPEPKAIEYSTVRFDPIAEQESLERLNEKGRDGWHVVASWDDHGMTKLLLARGEVTDGK